MHGWRTYLFIISGHIVKYILCTSQSPTNSLKILWHCESHQSLLDHLSIIEFNQFNLHMPLALQASLFFSFPRTCLTKFIFVVAPWFNCHFFCPFHFRVYEKLKIKMGFFVFSTKIFKVQIQNHSPNKRKTSYGIPSILIISSSYLENFFRIIVSFNLFCY